MNKIQQDVRVAIVGSGFAGLGMAIRLKQAGIDDFVVLEQADDVGGTWRDNTYPGCACDVPSHLYSFSFAPNPELDAAPSRRSPRSGTTCAAAPSASASMPHVRFGHEVLERELGRGRRSAGDLETSRGELTAQVARAGDGPAERAVDPRPARARTLRGRRRSTRPAGTTTHDLDGERVAVIGTGASAIQFVPQIQPRVGRLHSSSAPRRGSCRAPTARCSGWERRLYRALPAAQRLVRARHLLGARGASCSASGTRASCAGAERLALRHLRRAGRAIPTLRAQAHADLPHGLQAHPDLQRLPARRSGAAERRGRHRRHRARCASARS